MSGFVYAIGNAVQVKIGWSRDPMQRLDHFRVSCPMDVELLGLIPASKAQEAQLHELFQPWHLHGEWFQCIGPVAAFLEILPRPKSRTAERPKTSILTARKTLRESQAVFAARFGVDQATISRWETHGLSARPFIAKSVERIVESLRPQVAAE